MATVGSATSNSLIDVQSLVAQLMQIEQRPLQALAIKEAGFQTKITAYGQLKGALSAIGGSLAALGKADTYLKARATTTDSTVATATATGNAALGNYQLEVTQLAQQHKLATSGASPYASTSSVVGTGQITIQFGTYNDAHTTFTANPDKATKTIAIGSGSNTLAGVRDAINAAGAGVSATILNDGNGQRLVLTSSDSGAANGMKITVADDDGGNTDASGLSALAYDPAGAGGTRLAEVAQAKNALLKIDGIDVSASTNTVTSAIEGVSLQLVKANPGVKSSLSVTRDTGTATGALTTFVKTYNESAKVIDGLVGYDPATKKAGALQGDSTARNALSELRRVITAPLAAAPGDYTRLADIGIGLDAKGQLAIDSTKLQSALNADPAKVSRVLALAGRGSDARVQYVRAGANTQPGTYAISVGTPATRGNLVGNAAAGLTITAAVNDTLTVNLDDRAGSITLPAQTYASAAALATDLQSRINGITDFVTNKNSVSVAESGGVLTITSTRYGASSSVSVSGNAASGLFGAAPVATGGVDIAGTIGGGAATGSGRSLVSITGAASGLEVSVEATAAGAYGTLNYFEGVGAKLTTLIDRLTASGGSIQTRTDGIDRSMRNLSKDQAAAQRRLIEIERRYRAQYVALDASLQSMAQTSTYLSQQLASLAAQTK